MARYRPYTKGLPRGDPFDKQDCMTTNSERAFPRIPTHSHAYAWHAFPCITVRPILCRVNATNSSSIATGDKFKLRDNVPQTVG